MIDLLHDTVVEFRHIICNIRVVERIQITKHAIARTPELLTGIFFKGKEKCGRGDDEDMYIFFLTGCQNQ